MPSTMICDCKAVVTSNEPYWATPCGTMCGECMMNHARECKVCREEFDVTFLAAWFEHPDQVGESEYRAIYEVLNDALSCTEDDDDDQEVAISVLDSFIESATAMKKALEGIDAKS